MNMKFQKLLGFSRSLYRLIVNFNPDNEPDQSLRLNKKMFLFLWCNVFIYYTVVTFSSLNDPTSNKILFPITAALKILILRIKSYKTMIWCFIALALGLAYFSSFDEGTALRLIAVSLAMHNYSVMVPDCLVMRMIYLAVSYYIFQKPRDTIFALLEDGNINKLELSIKKICYAWPFLYLINHSVAYYLVKSYQRAIEDNKEAQKQLAATNQQLQDTNNRLKEALSMLEKTNKDLESSLKARELFIASVSHELRNPLNVMIGNIELLGLDALSPKQLQMLNTCKICGEVLLSLINNVLDVAKINAQKLELNYLSIDFYQLVEKIWNMSAMKIKQKDLNGTLYIERGFPKYIEMDSHRITQVLLNILGNASKFTTNGFIKVYFTWHQNEKIGDLKRPHPEYLKLANDISQKGSKEDNFTEEAETARIDSLDYIDIQLPRSIRISQRLECSQNFPQSNSSNDSLKYMTIPHDETKLPSQEHSMFPLLSRKKKGLIKISVIDTGCGISLTALNRIFLPFEQADSSITRRFGGTGLGLYISHEIIHKMGGEIFVYSKENVGTNFEVIIPAQIASERDIKKKTNETKVANCNKEIKALVVDDNHHNQLIICSFLSKMNIHSEIANNGKEAVEMFIKNGYGYYTLITMDLQMPIMDGLAACKRIRKFEAEQRVIELTPIIVVTGNCTNHEKSECLDPQGDIKANYFFRKPFTYDECKSAVQNITLDQRKARIKRNKRILIVDDDPFNQKIVQEYLSKYEFVCETCSTGEKALQKLRREQFDAVLMDCEMPGMDGYTASKHIKKFYPHMLIIGITGHTESQFIQKALESGMKYVLTKPMDFKKLVSLIST